jgi:DNA (cytosine-5)-methyltransferase 1
VLKFVDLFCGIGGFRVALEKRGLECVFSCDIDPHVQEVYKQNFGDKPSGDITENLFLYSKPFPI